MSTSPATKIGDNLSIHLDFLRLGAALVVVLTHGHNFLLPGIKFGPLAWGREAVAIFFVLSGFVISYVVQTGEKDWRVYLVARVARILPVALLALVVILVADTIGTRVDPAYYDYVNVKFDGFYVPVSAAGLWSYLTFSNQLWFQHAVFGTGEPYWSLGFEVQYYLFFGLLVFVPARWKFVSLLLWVVFVGPKILMYMPIWLMGVLTLRLIRSKPDLSRSTSIAFLVSSLVLFLALKYFGDHAAKNMYQTWPLQQEAINFIYFNLVGVAVMLHLLGAAALLRSMPPLPQKLRAAIKWLAGGSFTLYLTHQPIILMFGALLHPVENHMVLAAGLLVLTVALCLLLAELAERRKKVFAALMRKYLPSLAMPIRPVSVIPT